MAVLDPEVLKVVYSLGLHGTNTPSCGSENSIRICSQLGGAEVIRKMHLCPCFGYWTTETVDPKKLELPRILKMGEEKA